MVTANNLELGPPIFLALRPACRAKASKGFSILPALALSIVPSGLTPALDLVSGTCLINTYISKSLFIVVKPNPTLTLKSSLRGLNF